MKYIRLNSHIVFRCIYVYEKYCFMHSNVYVIVHYKISICLVTRIKTSNVTFREIPGGFKLSN